MTQLSSSPRIAEVRTKSTRLSSLDGWRAVSIIFVLGNHCQYAWGFPPQLDPLFTWCFEGNLGVRFFFVISGFLITWLMLVEYEKNGRVSLYHFYVRRALRILPVYIAFLCVLLGLQMFTGFSQSTKEWIGNLTFTTDFIEATWTSGHLWSLAVEEQFYLLWPIVFVLCGNLDPLRRSMLILTIPIFLAPIARVVSYLHLAPEILRPLFLRFSFFNCFDSLAIGCMSAIVFAHGQTGGYPRSRPILMAFVGAILILIPHVLLKTHQAGFFTATLGNTFQACGFCVLLVQSIHFPNFYFYRVLNRAWVQWVGVLSYSIYIWQQIFSTSPKTYGIGPVWWMSFPGWLIPVFVVATASYYGLERPFFKLRAYFRRP